MSPPRKDIHNSDVPVICQSCDSRHRGVCGALRPEELIDFAKHTRVVKHPAGQVLLHENGPIEAYGSVMHGVVKLTKSLADGRQQIVGLQFAPDFVGRLYVEESSVRAEASTELDICMIPRQAFKRMLDANPALESRLFLQSIREIDDAREWLLVLGRKTAVEKLASFVLMIAFRLGLLAQSNSSPPFELPLRRAEIGDFLGLTIGTVSRELVRLRNENLIALPTNRSAQVLDAQRLRERAEGV